MTVMSSKQYNIVNGAQLPNFMGQNISIFGLTTKSTSAGSTSFSFTTTDNVVFSVQLERPLTKDLGSGVYIEVRGVCSNAPNGKVIKAEDYFIFDNKTFDAKHHNLLCKFINSIPNKYSLKN